MNKFFAKFRDEEKGTALLTALLVMGVLMAVSLALSSLIFRETRIVKDLVHAGKAYYAAESGIEEALYRLNNELPGWHTAEEAATFELSDGANYQFEVKNTCATYPCFDEDEYELSGVVPPSALYDVLDLNENITLPLFVVESDENGNSVVETVEDFRVRFFTKFDPSTDLKITDIAGWDVLRWKVFGMRKIGDKYMTESIGDFTAVSTLSGSSGDDEMAGATIPSWFGTLLCGEGNEDLLPPLDEIDCAPYNFKSTDGQICDNTMVRDYYLYDDTNSELLTVSDCYPIKTFMENHQADRSGGLNYLSLTNLMNKAVFKTRIEGDKDDKAKIYFRVEAYGDQLVREVAEISASGVSGNNKQSISVQIKRGSYMPVFNFSIYSTYKNDAERCEWDLDPDCLSR